MSEIIGTLAGYIAGNADIETPAVFNVSYRVAGGTVTAATDTHTMTDISLIIPTEGETLITGSVQVEFGGKSYIDRMGQLYHSINPASGNGIFGGTINYQTGQCSLSAWQVGGANSGTVSAALSSANYNPVDRVVFRTTQAPIKPSSFSIRAAMAAGGVVSATSNDSGVISTNKITGTIDNNTGIVALDFGQWITAAGQESQPWFDPANVVAGKIFKAELVMAETIVYNAVSYTFLPLSSEILGLDPARLPVDGRIPVYHKGDVVVVLNDQSTVGTFASSQVLDLGRIRLSKITVRDLGNNVLAANKWSANLDTGIITFGDLAGVSQPLTIVDRIQDMAVLSDVQINGKLKLSMPATHNYPHTTTLVANAVVLGDIYAHASNPFDQQTWTGVWYDSLIGSATLAQYNYTAHPVETTNSGTIEERWLIQFTSATLFNLIGEHVGQIVTGASIGTDLAPINPATGDPYFTLRRLGFGGGWSAGNVLRFNTYQAAKPVWIIQSILQGDPTSDDFKFCLCFSGDVDAP